MGFYNKFDDKFSTTLLVAAVYPLGPAAIILMPMIIGGVIETYGFSEQQAGNVAAAEGMGVVISSIIASVWVRRVSWTKVLFVSFLLTALLNLFSSSLNEYMHLVMARFATGITEGMMFAVVVAALGDNSYPDRAFGIAQAVQGAMMFLAFAIAPYLVQHWGVNGLFYLLAAACVAMMLTLYRFPSAGVDHSERAVEHPKGVQGSKPLIWLGLIGSLIFFINIFGFWAFIERIGHGAGLPPADVGLALGVAQVIAIGGAMLAAWASDRFGRILPLLLVLFGQGLALWLLVSQFASTTFLLATGLFQALFMVGVSYQMGAIAKIDLQGKYLVLMTAAQGLGAAFGPSLAGVMISGGYSRINLLAAACLLVSITIFINIVQRSRKLVIGTAE